MKITTRTGVVRISFPNLDEPVSFNGGAPKYTVSLIIDDLSETLTDIENVIESVERKAWEEGFFDPNIHGNIKSPLREGNIDMSGKEEYADKYFVNATSGYKPTLVHNRKENGVLIEAKEGEIYAGSFGIANLTFYPYTFDGGAGIACGLNGIMKTRDGDRLDGRPSAEKLFEDVELIDDEGLLG